MKKGFALLLILFLGLILVGCDFPENSFKVLNEKDIPNKVTKDFSLPKGTFGTFEWTSSHSDVININGLAATVTQQEEDTLVTLTATINARSKDFNILVLKIGSDLSPYEQALKFIDHYSEGVNVNGEGILFPKQIGNLYFKYAIDKDGGYYFEDSESSFFVRKEKDQIETATGLEIDFFEMIDGKLTEIYFNHIILNFTDSIDLEFKVLPFGNYLSEIGSQLITNHSELDEYLEKIEVEIPSGIYINSIKNNEYFFNYYSLLLLNFYSPSMSHPIYLNSLTLNGSDLNVNLYTTDGPGYAAIIPYSYFIEIEKVSSDVTVNLVTNYIDLEDDSQVNKYLNIHHYVYNVGYLSNDYSEILIIDTYQKLIDYIEYVKELNTSYNGLYYSLYLEQLLIYSGTRYFDFEHNSIVIYNLNAGSGSIRYRYLYYQIDDGLLTIYFEQKIPEIGTTDIYPWNFIFSISTDFDEVDIKFVNTYIK